jgi:uncharacterized protein (TIGR03435 family)
MNGNMNGDMELLQDYATRRSENAFVELVSRHGSLVYAAALRQVRDPHLAEEVVQFVFILLARKAGSLGPKTILLGWLYRTARFASLRVIERESQRRVRENQALMESSAHQAHQEHAHSVWDEVAPLLDEGMAKLNARDRDAVVLRFFQNQSLKEVAAALGLQERAAQKRVARAVERLRVFFARHGVTVTARGLPGMITAHSLQSLPARLAAGIVASSVHAVAPGIPSFWLVKGAMKALLWAKANAAVVAVPIAILGIAGVTAVAVKGSATDSSRADTSWSDDPRYWRTDAQFLESLPPVFILRPTRFTNSPTGIQKGAKMISRNASIQALVAAAYDFSPYRVLLPESLSTQHFDMMFTLRTLSRGQARGMLQENICKHLGLTVQGESRTASVLLMKMKSVGAPGLKPAHGGPSGLRSTRSSLNMENESLSELAGFLEHALGKPVLDETGIKPPFDVHLQWASSSNDALATDALTNAVLDQLGIELIPENRSIEILTVRKTP